MAQKHLHELSRTTMQEYAVGRDITASEETLHSSNEEEDPFRGMEPYLVRRLSCRNVQLPPLAFRQLEQADLKSESENIPRPTSLPLKILPLIAITSADSSGCCASGVQTWLNWILCKVALKVSARAPFSSGGSGWIHF
uniref:cAMP-specific 3',5'-cyclic phosphodiesterase 4D-like n=1 Tax=Halichoerus grypus TaxID=9711 RepID=UPI0016591FD6|nr:cAMP-specific 3',5'-cyclic phosphodiesterase 4D-like [Halichoerus grypus]